MTTTVSHSETLRERLDKLLANEDMRGLIEEALAEVFYATTRRDADGPVHGVQIASLHLTTERSLYTELLKARREVTDKVVDVFGQAVAGCLFRKLPKSL